MKINDDIRIRFRQPNKLRKNRVYECIITDNSIDERFVGRSQAHASDIYDKNRGRALSLDRALSCSPYDRKLRSKIWAQFHNEPKELRFKH